MSDSLEEVKKFLDSEGVLDSSLKSNVPIPVEEIQPLLAQISVALWGFEYEVCGSYRRGEKTVRDIDLVISLKRGSTKTNDMSDVFSRFHGIGVKIVTHNHSGACLLAYMGDKPIRVDILFCEPYNVGVAKLFMTGSRDWNDLVRLYTSRKGVQFKPGGIVSRTGTSCFTSEEEALRFMGIAYVEPKDRVSGTRMLDLDGNFIGLVF